MKKVLATAAVLMMALTGCSSNPGTEEKPENSIETCMADIKSAYIAEYGTTMYSKNKQAVDKIINDRCIKNEGK